MGHMRTRLQPSSCAPVSIQLSAAHITGSSVHMWFATGMLQLEPYFLCAAAVLGVLYEYWGQGAALANIKTKRQRAGSKEMWPPVGDLGLFICLKIREWGNVTLASAELGKLRVLYKYMMGEEGPV